MIELRFARSVATATGVLSVSVFAVPPMTASAADAAETHCVLRMDAAADSSRAKKADLNCYPTLAEALAESGPPIQEPNGTKERSAALAASTIAIHFDGRNNSGSSISISGTECSGGHVNLTNDWVNRIRSTANFCPTVKFFDGFDKSGDAEATSGITNLGPLDRRANSVSYY